MRSYQYQRPYLQSAMDQIKSVAFCLQETHLKPGKDASLPNYHYPPLRADRLDSKGGGVAIFIHKSIQYIPLKVDTNLELVAAKVFINQKPIDIANAYFPPQMTTDEIEEALDIFKANLTSPFIITFDSNAHHTDWGSPEHNIDNKGKIISEWIEENGIQLLNNGEPTWMSPSGTFSHIDLTLCSQELAAGINWYPHYDPCNSDHFPIILD